MQVVKSKLAIAAATILLLAGCTEKQPHSPEKKAVAANPPGDLAPLEERVTVLMAEDGAASGAGFYIAKEKGYFEDYNIDAQFVQFPNSDEMLPALAAGEIDIAGGVSTASFFNAIAQGINVRIIADKGHIVNGQGYLTFVKKKDSKIEGYEDLRGKKIAISSVNSINHYLFDRMLEHAGLTEKDVERTVIGDFGSMLGAIDNESVDLALNIEPMVTQGIGLGLHELFGDTSDYAPDTQIAMVLGSPQFMSQEKDVSVRFMLAYLKGLRDYNNAFVKGINQDEIIDIMTKHTALKDRELWKNVHMIGLDPDGEMNIEDIRRQFEHYKAAGAIAGEIDFDETIDSSAAEEAAKILGPYE
jgi:NitT/TauT family transport system substrate-binding protein